MADIAPDTDPGDEIDEVDEADEKIRVFDDLSPVTWTLLISAFIHFAFVIPVILFAASPEMESFDFDWVGEFEELQGIGHGQSEAWEEIEAATMPDEEEAAVEEEEVVEEEVIEEVVEEIEEVFEPEAEPVLVQEPREATAEEPAAAVVEAPPKEEPSDPIAESERLPGLNHAGPSDLPDLRHYGPGNARVTMLVRIDRLRDTPYEANLKRLIEAVPDYRILLEATNLDPVRELDSMFMATADPRYLHETFLAVRHGMDHDALKGVLANRFTENVPWEAYGDMEARPLVPKGSRYQDPRMLLLARPGLTIVGKPEWLGEMTKEAGEDSALAQDLRDPDGALPVFTLIDGLQQIERAAESDDTLVLISAWGIYMELPGVGTLPRFQAVRMAVENAAAPRLIIDLNFATTDEARRFADSCPAMARQLISSIPMARMLGIAAIVERLSCKADEEYVTVRGDYTAQEMSRILQLATPFIPRPPALTGLPRPPAPPPVVEVEKAAEAEDEENE
ncbi:MAG: hypothetical protein ACNA8W_09410 [Bradymonadaceae bacterium]